MKRRSFSLAVLRASLPVLGLSLCLTGCPPNTPGVASGEVTIRLIEIASGLTAPTELVLPDDGTGRMFLAEQNGRIQTLAADGSRTGTLLDLTDRLVTLSAGYDERGLLGLALHPQFAANGRLFVYYVAPAGDDLDPVQAAAGESRVSEFQLAAGATTIDPDSERIILRFGQPQATHNAGKLAFGPDGYLYIATGDGGSRGDSGPGHGVNGNAQDLTSLLGKILRIVVDGAEPYTIPGDNPFLAEAGARAEIFALGLRNPWRFSFDPTSGTPRLLVGDVGQSLREEISLVSAGDNCGWRIREGDLCFNVDNLLVPLDDCDTTDARGGTLVEPLISYPHASGTSIVGGVLCTATGISDLDGRYLFGDFSLTTGAADGRLYVADPFGDNPGTFGEVEVENLPNGKLGRYLYGFAEGPDGTVYVLANGIPTPGGADGVIYRVAAESDS